MTLNQTVNNWFTEIETFNINFVHISGKDNVLTDTLSRLIDTDPDIKQQPELEGNEFDKYYFEILPKVRGSVHHERVNGEEFDMCEIQITYNNPENLELSVKLPLENGKFVSLQENAPTIWEFLDKVKNGMYNEFYFVKNDVLFRSILDNGHIFGARVIPDLLVDVVLHLGFEESGTDHNKTVIEIEERARSVGMRFNPTKCQFKPKQVKFFGLILTHDGVIPDPAKSKALRKLPQSNGQQYGQLSVQIWPIHGKCDPQSQGTIKERCRLKCQMDWCTQFRFQKDHWYPVLWRENSEVLLARIGIISWDRCQWQRHRNSIASEWQEWKK